MDRVHALMCMSVSTVLVPLIRGIYIFVFCVQFFLLIRFCYLRESIVVSISIYSHDQ